MNLRQRMNEETARERLQESNFFEHPKCAFKSGDEVRYKEKILANIAPTDTNFFERLKAVDYKGIVQAVQFNTDTHSWDLAVNFGEIGADVQADDVEKV